VVDKLRSNSLMGHVVTPPAPTNATPDAVKSWIDLLPAGAQAYARLARLDRPAGTWLLFWPCIAGLALAGGLQRAPWLVLWFGLGSIAMRGAGCVWNDIVDRDLDAQVERTRDRPVASGRISVKAALAFAVALSLIGLVVLLQLRGLAQIVALASLILVAAYPFMKRITWWPQAWLGLTFNWGALVGWAAIAPLDAPEMWLLWAGGIAWTLGYDTIYALQDREDDALIGVRSTARLFGKRAALTAFCFHLGAAALIALAAWFNDAGRIGALAALGFLTHGAWQTMRLKASGEQAALAVFKSNVWAGAIVAVGFLIAALIPERAPKTIFAKSELVPPTRSESVDLPFGLELRRKPAPKPDVWLARDIRRAMEIRGLDPDATETTPER